MHRLIALIVSATLLVLLYYLVDFANVIGAARAADVVLLAVGIGAIVPLVLGTAWRFSILTRTASIGILRSIELTLIASTLNLFLPSKMGDVAKAAVLVNRDGMNGKLALSICLFEKALDLASLLLLGGIALLYVAGENSLLRVLAAATAVILFALAVVILPGGFMGRAAHFTDEFVNPRIGAFLKTFSETWESVTLWFWSDRRRAAAVLVLSLAIWAGHLMQFWLFAEAVGATIPILDNMAFATLGILAGLLPVTFAGIGSRDVALVHFYGPYLTPGEGALIGILATLRYVIPALAGLPFLGQSIQRLIHFPKTMISVQLGKKSAD
jgi:glycosyltransferase 2 family protein